MRDPNRLYKFYNELQTIHITYFPDWRFGQFIENFRGWIQTNGSDDLFYYEEDEFLKLINRYKTYLKSLS